MKKIFAVALVLFTIFMSYVVVGGFIQKQASENNTVRSLTSTTPAKQAVPTSEFTVDSVAQHSSADDCWIVIGGKVYDVSDFLRLHPGGAHTISPYCGKEATNAFQTQNKGSRGGHSARANEMLGEYMVGILK